ncbi:MAG: T9SS type A sorting domain-containing protein [Bacteroidota bacterium]|nr:T9SS type A sorting domain-containing protein [Bacteroidota bacterium]MDX5505693.1 T9SS type A sorting domain-containing protein [Bacteroidota bacterium]
MYKRLLLTISIMGMMIQAQASHLLGGEIWSNVVVNQGTQQVEIWLTLYRDVQGIALPSTSTVSLKNQSGSTSNFSLQRIATPVTLPGPSGLVSGYGIELNVYYGVFNLPAGTTSYTVAYSNCCRPMGISNMTNSGGESFWISSTNDISHGLNSNAYSLLPLAIYAQAGTPISISHQHMDLEGDSLAYYYAAPFSQQGQPVAGYSLPSGTASGPFSVDSISGLLTWTPAQQGVYAYRFIVHEYRKDSLNQFVKIGEKNRDMVFLVGPASSGGSSLSVSLGGTNGTLPNGVPFAEMKEGMVNSVTLTIGNIDSTSFSADFYGEPLELDSANVNLVVTPSQQGSGTGVVEIQWAPSSQMVRTEPYMGTVRITVGGFTYDVLIGFKVLSTASIQENESMDAVLFPNPMIGEDVQVYHPSGVESWSLIDLSGRLIHSGKGSGAKYETIHLSGLSEGVFILQVKDQQGRIHVHRLIR